MKNQQIARELVAAARELTALSSVKRYISYGNIVWETRVPVEKGHLFFVQDAADELEELAAKDAIKILRAMPEIVGKFQQRRIYDDRARIDMKKKTLFVVSNGFNGSDEELNAALSVIYRRS